MYAFSCFKQDSVRYMGRILVITGLTGHREKKMVYWFLITIEKSEDKDFFSCFYLQQKQTTDFSFYILCLYSCMDQGLQHYNITLLFIYHQFSFFVLSSLSFVDIFRAQRVTLTLYIEGFEIRKERVQSKTMTLATLVNQFLLFFSLNKDLKKIKRVEFYSEQSAKKFGLYFFIIKR